ncbi:MAG TPA: thioredoxin fold domain-containing protein [Fimbriimonadaceae bacterium]|nr:thioredoxin fold domain-containing protein [Fimbriimonadaceae bacterium]
MKRSFVTILLMALALGAYAAEINWAKGYEGAKNESKTTGKLLMIDFYTDWCGWCKKLDADVYPDASVVKQSENFVPIKLNAEKDADGIRLAKKFNITGYPTILFIDANENLAYKIVGYSPAPQFADALGKAAASKGAREKFETALKANPNDFDALAGLATLNAGIGESAKAADYVNRAAKAASAAQKGALLDAYNAVGDGFQNDEKFGDAVPYFQKAIDPAFPKQSAYARISLAVCYLSSRENKKAIPYLQDLLKMGKEADEYRDQAKQMLEAAQKGN